MRRNFRKTQQNDKIIIYSAVGVVVLLTMVFTLLMYGESLNNQAKNGGLSSDQIASIVENTTDSESESASSNIGKSVEEQEIQENTTTETNVQDTEKTENKINTINNATNTDRNIQNTTSTTAAKVEQNMKNTEKKKELSFQMPVEGEIVREFAKENLIYSETLQEWVTHMGIDIKAEKTSVVQAAEDGTVKSIKNDPRYGLTIVIEHEDGFETIYANLLSSEFVSEGEKVIKGQSIGTIGNTAVFESVDEPHLHFEVLKDSIQVDPSIYLK